MGVLFSKKKCYSLPKKGDVTSMKRYQEPTFNHLSNNDFFQPSQTQYVMDFRDCLGVQNFPLVLSDGEHVESCGNGPLAQTPYSMVLQCSETPETSYSFTVENVSMGEGSIDCSIISMSNLTLTLSHNIQSMPEFCTVISQVINDVETCS